MHAFSTLASLALLCTRLALVQGYVYVTNPVQSTTCHGGQSCSVEWIDNGESPLLSAIGECEVGLYTGEYELAQALLSVDVATSSSFTFTPSPDAGPNGQYYLVFTASSVDYNGFSGSFTLDGMTGTTPGGGAGGSSAPAGASTPAGSSTPGTSTPTDTSTPTETSTPTTTPTATTLSVSTPVTATFPTTTPTATFSTATPSVSSPSASASASPTNAAMRVGSSTSLGASLFLALAGAFFF
ncbi:hypothetical protein PAXRUDRAFT_832465 [Paxillus rubicundulus Ve08.2h10]|uniref:Unplaced genomic scaffold scaffold_871, whole genome shotgun sequence n=1 Tax=Paxillus rubicundulus Ve08.2h10 TaxID=930991 RepID=A0A0D0CH45_9AGAM|nr:hypothetical protein PAXRUDRAFT_832465 [Paxillus rubicundulus Ve08.2h10]